jgi:hypothetical protein
MLLLALSASSVAESLPSTSSQSNVEKAILIWSQTRREVMKTCGKMGRG